MIRLHKLRGRIYEKYKSVKAFANDMGMSSATVYNVLNMTVPIRPVVMKGWCRALDISEADEEKFFCPEKSEN